ncbi:unnamed protein product [Boreogadus saida]
MKATQTNMEESERDNSEQEKDSDDQPRQSELVPKSGATSIAWTWFGFKKSDTDQKNPLWDNLHVRTEELVKQQDQGPGTLKVMPVIGVSQVQSKIRRTRKMK